MIISQDICFFEDTSFSELVVIDISTPWILAEIVDHFVNNIKIRDGSIINAELTSKSSSVISHVVPNILMNIINDKVFTNLSVIKHFVTLDYSALNSSFLYLLISFSKRDLSVCDYKLVFCYQSYRSLIITNTVFSRKEVNFVFVTIVYKPHISEGSLFFSY